MSAVEAAKPSPDQAAAHEFLTELRTRVSTQPLPYQFGVESRALESLWEIFGHARSAIKKYPGCEEFARRTSEMLNLDLRPVTSKWHRAHSEGRLNSRDGANEFREDLDAVRDKLRAFARELHEMAYGTPREDALAPEPMDDAALTACLTNLPFGIRPDALIPDVADINAEERKAVEARREKFGIKDGGNAIGLGLSGGGIRSSTFCLGVTQVLAERGLLKDVDFLSTVSGGGYLGCFLTTRLESQAAHSRVAASHGPDSEAIRYLRQRAKYLTADNLKERWMMVTATLAGMVLNWTAPLFLLAFAALVAVGITRLAGNAVIPWHGILLALVAATLISLLVYAFRMRYTQRTGGRILGWLTAATLFVAFVWLLTWAYKIFIGLDLTLKGEMVGVAGAAAVTAFPAIVRFVPILRTPAVRQIVLKVMLIIAGLIIPLGGIVLSFWLYRLGMRSMEPSAAFLSPFRYAPGPVVLAALTAISFLVAFFLLNINLTAPHRLYRDQLARTFIRLGDGRRATRSRSMTSTRMASRPTISSTRP